MAAIEALKMQLWITTSRFMFRYPELSSEANRILNGGDQAEIAIMLAKLRRLQAEEERTELSESRTVSNPGTREGEAVGVVSPTGGKSPQVDGKESTAKWGVWNDKDTEPPKTVYEKFHTGSKKQLSRWVCNSDDQRAINGKVKKSVVWGRKINGNTWHVFYKSQLDYSNANSRKVAEENDKKT